MTETPPPSPLQDRTNARDDPSSTRKRQLAGNVGGGNHEDNGLPSKTPKMTDEPKEADPKVQFGTAGEIDTAAEEKGANNVSAGGVSEDADRVKEGGLTVEELIME